MLRMWATFKQCFMDLSGWSHSRCARWLVVKGANKHLGSVITDEGSKPEILSRYSTNNSSIDKAEISLYDRSISLSSKIRLMRSLVTSFFLLACESWTLTAELQRRIQAMEMRCYRKILHISYKDHVTNEEVRAKIQQAFYKWTLTLTIQELIYTIRDFIGPLQ